MNMATTKGGSMRILVVMVAVMATTSVEARIIDQQQQHQNHNLQPDHDSTDWIPYLPTSFRTALSTVSSPIDHGLISKKSPIAVIDAELSLTPVKNEKKKTSIKKSSSKALSQHQAHHRSKRWFLAPKQKLRAVAVPFSIFHFLGFMPLRIPGLPFHNDLPSPERHPYRTTHKFPLKPKRRRRLFWK